MAYYEYVSASIVELVDTVQENNRVGDDDYDSSDDCTVPCDDAGKMCKGGEQTYDVRKQIYEDGEQIYDDGKQTYDVREQIYDDTKQIYDVRKQIYDDGKQTYEDDEQTYDVHEQIYDVREQIHDVREQIYEDGVATSNAVHEKSADSGSVSSMMFDDDEECGYSKFCLGHNETVEGTVCRVSGPTSLTLMIMKIGGVDLSASKDKMYNVMYNKCGALPPIDRIVPGMKCV